MNDYEKLNTQERIAKLEEQVQELLDSQSSIRSETTIPYDIEEAFKERFRLRTLDNIPAEFADLPLSAITPPSGGATVDSQSRTAIASIIDTLENAGIIES
jgi:hypothetical protein